MHLFICLFVTDFIRKMRVCLGLAIEPLSPFNAQKKDFLPNKAFRQSINDDFKKGCVTGTTSSMATSQFKYNT